MLRDHRRRVTIALMLGLTGAALGLAFYCVFLIDFFNIINFRDEVSLALIRLSVILGTMCGLVAFLLSKGYECTNTSLENRRRFVFLLGVLEVLLMGWLAVFAILAWIGLAPAFS